MWITIGNFKIGDFGIARICDKASADLSKKGTENYMAPEVFHGKDYDHTVDIYSLGLVLYKLLNNNRLPFYPETGSYSEWDMQQALIDRLSGKKELPPPCAASEEFGKIVLRMCAHDPAERYQNAKEILAGSGADHRFKREHCGYGCGSGDSFRQQLQQKPG